MRVTDMVPVWDINEQVIYFPETELVRRTAVYGIILNNQSEVVLTTLWQTGRFYLPGGGVDIGETLELALRRECREECDLYDLRIERKVTEQERFFTPDGVRAWHQTSHIYLTWSNQRDLRFMSRDPAEQDLDPKWVSVDQLRGLDQFQAGICKVVLSTLREVCGS